MIEILQSVGRSLWTFAFERLETGESGVIRTNIVWKVLGPISKEFSSQIFWYSSFWPGRGPCPVGVTLVPYIHNMEWYLVRYSHLHHSPWCLACPRAAIGCLLHANYDWAAGEQLRLVFEYSCRGQTCSMLPTNHQPLALCRQERLRESFSAITQPTQLLADTKYLVNICNWSLILAKTINITCTG